VPQYAERQIDSKTRRCRFCVVSRPVSDVRIRSTAAESEIRQMKKGIRLVASLIAMGAALAVWSAARRSAAHCDTMDGPVVSDAKRALAKGDVAPALKWVSSENEPELRKTFLKVASARKAVGARQVADQYFFETLVRLHRAGEGAPYTGLKPAGTKLEPGVAEADRAIATGSADALEAAFAREVHAGLRARLDRVLTTKKRSESSVGAGREFIEAYVEFVHYSEGLYAAAHPAHNHGDTGHEAREAH
jgi:hypothetical protein